MMSEGTPPGYETREEKMAASNHDAAAAMGGEEIYQFLDPLDPRRVSLEIFELYCHEMISTPIVGRRAYLIKKMRYMVKRLIGHQYPYGRLFNRTCIANMIARICARQPYSVNDDSDVDDRYNFQLSDCLVDWAPDKWKTVIVQFENLRESLLRKDAALIVLPGEVSLDDDDKEKEDEEPPPMEDDDVNPSLASAMEFVDSYSNLLNLMEFHMCLSHIQPQFENAIQKGSFAVEEAVVIPHEDIVAFDNEIQERFGDGNGNKYAVILNSLLESSKKTSRSGRSEGLYLKSFDEIKNIYDSNLNQFDLGRFQNKFLLLLRRWSEMVLPVPALAKVGYGSTTPPVPVDNKENVSSLGSTFATKPSNQHHKRKKLRNDSAASVELEEKEDPNDDEGEGENENTLDRLKRSREALMKNVKDPLEECVQKAQSARTRTARAKQVATESTSTVSTPNFRKKKTTSYKLAFTDSEDEDDDNDHAQGKGITLSKVPEPFKQKVDVAPKKIEVLISAKTKQSKRNKFTDIEDAAIRTGVERFGAGRWADIKSYYHIDLADRSSVQIKDRWRTLNKP